MEKHTAGMCLFCSLSVGLTLNSLVSSFVEVSAQICVVNVIITF